MINDHERGPGLPSSLESAHHIGADGEPIYSPAQIAAGESLRSLRPEEPVQHDEPPWLHYSNPAHLDEERREPPPEPMLLPEPEPTPEPEPELPLDEPAPASSEPTPEPEPAPDEPEPSS